MTPFMRWHSKLRHSPVFTVVKLPGKARDGSMHLFAGEVDADELFWDQFDPADKGSIEIPCDVARQKVKFTVYRLSAAGYEKQASKEDMKMLNEYRRDAILYSDRMRAGEFVIEI